MEYELKLGSKKLQLRSSVFTIYKYQHEFNRDIYKDIQSLGETGAEAFDISRYVLTITRILYVLTQGEQSFEQFAETIDPDDLLSELSSQSIIEALQLLIPKKGGGNNTAPQLKR